ncbi:MAG: hypothetical protein CMG04_06080 [Candidatus Marinimicrobia bacterium]|nr:hypothetical protein [Candidatus Neomarinimicrobiota bacterium]
MRYIQKVKIDCSDIKKVKGEFNNILFLKHLTKLLPVKIIEWDGTYDGAKAHLAFWFFGWRDFIVNHRENIEDDIKFSFVDEGISLPFYLKSWRHIHGAYKERDLIIIKDEVNFTTNSKFLDLILFPMLMMPIIIRKILYKTYDWG